MKKTKNYGVVVDTVSGSKLPRMKHRNDSIQNYMTQKQYDRLTQFEKQVIEVSRVYKEKNLLGLRGQAKAMCDRKIEAQLTAGIRPTATVNGYIYHLLHTARLLVVITEDTVGQYYYISTALTAKTPVYLMSPLHNDGKMFEVEHQEHFQRLIQEETKKQDLIKGMNTAARVDEYLQLRGQNILKRDISWFKLDGSRYYMQDLLNFCGSIDNMTEFMQSWMDRAEETSEYDLGITETFIMRERMSSWYQRVQHGVNKGNLEFNSADIVDYDAYWMNQEVTWMDIAERFIHMTYLISIGERPLRKVGSVDNEYTVSWAQDNETNETLTMTPLYVDPYSEREEDYTEETIIPQEVKDIIEAIGTETLLELGYEKALQCVRYNLARPNSAGPVMGTTDVLEDWESDFYNNI